MGSGKFRWKPKAADTFLVENNRYSTASDQLKRNAADNISDRVKPFGVRSQRIFGNDCPLAYRTISEEIDRLRKGMAQV